MDPTGTVPGEPAPKAGGGTQSRKSRVSVYATRGTASREASCQARSRAHGAAHEVLRSAAQVGHSCQPSLRSQCLYTCRRHAWLPYVPISQRVRPGPTVSSRRSAQGIGRPSPPCVAGVAATAQAVDARGSPSAVCFPRHACSIAHMARSRPSAHGRTSSGGSGMLRKAWSARVLAHMSRTFVSLCCDATLVSPITGASTPHPRADHTPGIALRRMAESRKRATYPELQRGANASSSLLWKSEGAGTLTRRRLSDSSSKSGLSVRRRPSELPPPLFVRAGGGACCRPQCSTLWRHGPGSTVAGLQKRRWVRACLGPRVGAR